MKRIRWIDIAKGLGILLVVVGHSRLGNFGLPFNLINSFHMPLFFLLAGYCLDVSRYKSFWGYFIRKLQVLGYPLIMLVFLQGLIGAFLYYGSDLKWGLVGVFQSILPDRFSNVMWFVEVLLVVEVLYWPLYAVLRGKAILFALGLAFLPEFVNLRFCSLDVFFVSLFFYSVGQLAKRLSSGRTLPLDVKHALVLIVGGGLPYSILVGLTAVDGVCYVTHNIGTFPVYAITALMGSIVLVLIAIAVDVRLNRLAVALEWLGKNSIVLLAIHTNLGAARHSWQMNAGLSQILELSLMILIMWIWTGRLKWWISWKTLCELVRRK